MSCWVASPDTPIRILVADDDITIRHLFRKALEQTGYIVEEAKNGLEALQAVTDNPPDIVLMDVMMPEMDGFESCRRIRAQQHTSNVPVIIVTGLDDNASIETAYDVGATDFIIKPTKLALVRHRVRYVLRQQQVAHRLRESESRLANAQRIARLGNWECDLKNGRLYLSDAAYPILDIQSASFDDTLAGFLQAVHPDDVTQLTHKIEGCRTNGGHLSLDFQVLIADGSSRFIHLEAETLIGERDRPSRLVGTIQDITERQRAQEQIRFMACHDSVTGLLNRKVFKENLTAAVTKAAEQQHGIGVLMMGLERFKRVNDTLGQEVGDAMLREVATRLKQCVQQWDDKRRNTGKTLVTRFGSDKFTLLLDPLEKPDAAARLAQFVLSRMDAPFKVGRQKVYLSSSIGIALFPNDGDTPKSLMRNTEAALRHAKTEGQQSLQFYTDSMNHDATVRLDLENKLRQALDNNELFLHYQPKVDLKTGIMVGAEALVRWKHPELGVVSPAQFVPIAEESGLIGPIGEWVLRTACEQTRAWQEQGLPPIKMSVNLSPVQFWDPQLPPKVAQSLVDSGLSPRYLELEITESTFMGSAEDTIRMLTELKRLGISLSVDDFGTGYSSLAYLQRFPIDCLKIDRSFVVGSSTDQGSATITSAVIAMAHKLGLSVIAEGVETTQQLTFLQAEECDQIQGFLFSCPLSTEDFADLLAEGRRLTLDVAPAPLAHPR